MISHSTRCDVYQQPETAMLCAAKAMPPRQRQELAVAAVAGVQTVSRLARQHEVSRKFVYRQAGKAQEALLEAFSPEQAGDDEVLFYLPVTKAWLRQLILGLTLICHSSSRGVVELLRDLFDFPISVGTVHGILQQKVEQARACNRRQNLSGVRIGAHDEIFQHGRPVLVGVDVASTYCYLLSLEEHRDADTWGVRLLELEDQDFQPDATIADAGQGIRAGQALAMPEVPCRGDVFHAFQTVQSLVTFLENRACAAIDTHAKLERKTARVRRRGERTHTLARKRNSAGQAADQAIALADDVSLLNDWLRRDVLSLAGPDHATRHEMFDFIVAELRAREPLCPHRVGPVVRALSHQRDDLLAFAAALDEDLTALAAEFQVPVEVVRDVLNVEALEPEDPARWPAEAVLRERLGNRYFSL